MFQSLSKPNLDDRLPRYTKAGGLTIELLHNPKREINIDALLLLARARGGFEIEFADHDVPSIKSTIEFRTVYEAVPLFGVSDGQK